MKRQPRHSERISTLGRVRPVAKKTPVKSATSVERNGAPADANGAPAGEVLVADIIIKNAPDPVFVSDLEGKILQANDAVSQLLGFRQDEVVEQSLSRFISAEETREFTAALREVVERGVTRNAVLNPRSASGEVIPTTLNASALRDRRRKRDRRDRRAQGHARAGQSACVRGEPDQERARPGVRLRPRGQDPRGQRRRLRAPRLPPGRGRRAVALTLHQRRGDTRVHRRAARGGRERRHPERAPQPARRDRRGHPHHR